MTKPLDQLRPTLRASVVAVPPRHRFTACIGRLSAAVGTGRARCLWKAVAVCWANALPVTASEADRALRPMLPTSAWEPWPFCVVRESCHAAVPDQPGLPSMGSGRRTGGSRHRPHLSPDLPLTAIAWIQRLLGYAAWLCFSQIASQQLKRQHCTPASKSSRLEPVVCDCALTGNVPSTRAG